MHVEGSRHQATGSCVDLRIARLKDCTIARSQHDTSSISYESKKATDLKADPGLTTLIDPFSFFMALK